MLQSQLFSKAQKKVPQEEKSINAQLLIRAGFIDKLMAGVYSYLPLGFKVLKKIENIIRSEMDNIGAQEVFLPVLHPKHLWQQTNRWRYPEMFKLKSRLNKEYSLGWTHEEIITPLVQKFISSYKELPVYVYQIQDKFRDELRAKAGLLRATEFIMKDLYSFHQDEEDLDEYYQKVKNAYLKIFKRCGIGEGIYLTLASGGTFSKYSHEFQVITPSGEDTVYLCLKCKLGINKEIIKEEKFRCPQCENKKLEIKKAIEAGNIFKLKEKFSQPFGFFFKDERGKEKSVLMGCYGIGLGRLMGTIVEVYHDEKGIIWPIEISPFQVHLIEIRGKNLKIKKTAQKLYKDLEKKKIEILYDDRIDKSPGEKFAEADLIGIPLRVVISERTLTKNCLEIKERKKQQINLIKTKEFSQFLKKFFKKEY